MQSTAQCPVRIDAAQPVMRGPDKLLGSILAFIGEQARSTTRSGFEKGSNLLFRRKRQSTPSGAPLQKRVSELYGQSVQLLAARDDASTIQAATSIIGGYASLGCADQGAYLDLLESELGPEWKAAHRALLADDGISTESTRQTVLQALGSQREELFHRIGSAPGGTQWLLELRTAISRDGKITHPGIEQDLVRLLRFWFNRSFLTLRHLNWGQSAALLEKLIAYEAVHRMDGWDDLKRRTAPKDRHIFALFHPVMPDEPLIFTEVALSIGVPDSMARILPASRAHVDPSCADTAAFYSISSCQAGLRGIPFGDYLIKSATQSLLAQWPNIRNVVTLSPMPGFRQWLASRSKESGISERLSDISTCDEKTKAALLDLARTYLSSRAANGRPIDPVARFHLGNGAEIGAVHWLADRSSKGIDQSFGIMVNYKYKEK